MIDRFLGADGAGQLYVATLQPQRARTIVRIPPAPYCAAGPVRQGILNKLVAFARIKSPHVAQAVPFEHPDLPNRWMIVMSLGNAFSLAERIEKKDLTPAGVVAVMKQALAGLRTAHAAGFLHGDLCPENIAVGADGRVKILNFAFIPLGAEDRRAKASYQAPELAKGGAISAATDNYALGRVFLQLFKSVGVVTVPMEVRRVAERMYSQDPATRICSVEEAIAALEANLKPLQVETAQQIVTKSFERTRTLQIDLEAEIRRAKVRDRMPKPMTVAIFAAIAYFAYVKGYPLVRGKSFSEVTQAVQSKVAEVTNATPDAAASATAPVRRDPRGAAAEVKREADEADRRKLADADAATQDDVPVSK